jgi:hypothetical protein
VKCDSSVSLDGVDLEVDFWSDCFEVDFVSARRFGELVGCGVGTKTVAGGGFQGLAGGAVSVRLSRSSSALLPNMSL